MGIAGTSLVGLLSLIVTVSAMEIVAMEFFEVSELSPVDINHTVPTGMLPTRELPELNLPVWVRNVTRACIHSIEVADISIARLSDFIGSVQSLVDSDLTVHACMFGTGSCNVTSLPTEDKSRYLDLRFILKSSESLRVVTTEDAAKAVNVPLEFDTVINSFIINGSATQGKVVGKNLAPSVAAAFLRSTGINWANGSLVDIIVTTTKTWPWQKCIPRVGSGKSTFDVATSNAASSEGSVVQGQDVNVQGLSFEETIRAGLTGIEKYVPGKWAISLGGPISGQYGLSFTVYYVLCGHLMMIPVTVQSWCSF